MRKVALISAVALIPLLFPETTNAFTRNVRFCNRTTTAVQIAAGYERTATDTTRTEGWFTAQVCQCITLFNEDVRETEFYIYVKREGSAIDDAISGGRAPLCIRGPEFRFGKSNANAETCANSGGRWVNFQQMNTDRATNYTVNFGSGANCQD